MDAEIFLYILYRLKDHELLFKKFAAICVRESEAVARPRKAELQRRVRRRVHHRGQGQPRAPKIHHLYILLCDASEDLKNKAKKALKSLLQMCSYLPALEPLISEEPQDILQYVLRQFAKNLTNDNQTKK